VARWIVESSKWWRIVYQPYLYAYDPRLHIPRLEVAAVPALTGAAALLFLVLAIALCRPPYRPLIIGASSMILYHAGITALGQVTLLRYVAAVSPFFLIVSGLVLVSVFQEVIALLRYSLTVVQTQRDATSPMVQL
jgi:hypothetical protein